MAPKNPLVQIEVDHDVREMALRIAKRIGKGLSDTLQDGLIGIARGHGWSITIDPDEELAEGKREEFYILWTALEPDNKALVVRLLEHPENLSREREAEQLRLELAEATRAAEVALLQLADIQETARGLGRKLDKQDERDARIGQLILEKDELQRRVDAAYKPTMLQGVTVDTPHQSEITVTVKGQMAVELVKSLHDGFFQLVKKEPPRKL